MNNQKKGLFTETRIEITKRIDNGQTQFVSSRKDAEHLTRHRRYFFEVYDEKFNHVGFGIPQ